MHLHLPSICPSGGGPIGGRLGTGTPVQPLVSERLAALTACSIGLCMGVYVPGTHLDASIFSKAVNTQKLSRSTAGCRLEYTKHCNRS